MIYAGARLEEGVICTDYCSIHSGAVVGGASKLQYRSTIGERVTVGADCRTGGFLRDATRIGARTSFYGETVHAYDQHGGEAELADRHSSAKLGLSRSWMWIRREDQETLLRVGLCRGVAASRGCRVPAKHELADEAVLAECASHKLYDLLGDLFILGSWPRARIFARNPGHRLNNTLLTFLSTSAAALGGNVRGV